MAFATMFSFSRQHLLSRTKSNSKWQLICGRGRLLRGVLLLALAFWVGLLYMNLPTSLYHNQRNMKQDQSTRGVQDSHSSEELNLEEPLDLRAKDVEIGRSKPSLQGIRDLIARRVPEDDVQHIELEWMDDADAKEEHYEWKVSDENKDASSKCTLTLRANSLSAMSRALGDFYSSICGMTLLSWADWSRPIQPCLESCSTLPVGSRTKRVRAVHPIRYGWNVVTFSYSTTYWDWPRYEQELDWLALRGVNLFLAHEGQEALLAEVFKEYITSIDQPPSLLSSLTWSKPTPSEVDVQVNRFFTHQTYFAWNRMGNINQVAGPPDASYVLHRASLQLEILKRMRELGIKPILPGFNGFVPRELPGSVCPSKLWSGFSLRYSSVCRCGNLDLLKILASRFVAKQLNRYKEFLPVDEPIYFTSDLYNENPVLMEDERILAHLAKTISLAHIHAAKEAGYPMRSTGKGLRYVAAPWMGESVSTELTAIFREQKKRSQAIRLGLDEKWTASTGQQIVFCVLHNFGGGGGIAGEIALTLARLKRFEERYRGVGFAPEGLEQNEVVYDSILSAAFREVSGASTSVDLVAQRGCGNNSTQMLDTCDYVKGRYRLGPDLEGEASPRIIEAWNVLLHTAYKRTFSLGGFGPTKAVWEIRPLPGLMINGKFMPTVISYSCDVFHRIVSLLVNIPTKGVGTAFYHDMVDFTRQMLSDLALETAVELQRANLNDDKAGFDKLKTLMLSLLDHVGALLASHPQFCFQDVQCDFCDNKEKARLLYRQLVTVWHAENSGLLADYGSKQKGGPLFEHVHRRRWQILLRDMKAFSQGYYLLEKQFFQIEQEFFESTTSAALQFDCAKILEPQLILARVKSALEFFSSSGMCKALFIGQERVMDDEDNHPSQTAKRQIPIFGRDDTVVIDDKVQGHSGDEEEEEEDSTDASEEEFEDDTSVSSLVDVNI